MFASEKGGLWTENFQIWGLVNWKFPNLGACELKISKFGGFWAENFQIWGFWAKIWVKLEAVQAKISKFSHKGVLWSDSFAWNGTLANYRRGVKRVSSGPHIPISPFLLAQCPPGNIICPLDGYYLWMQVYFRVIVKRRKFSHKNGLRKVKHMITWVNAQLWVDLIKY